MSTSKTRRTTAESPLHGGGHAACRGPVYLVQPTVDTEGFKFPSRISWFTIRCGSMNMTSIKRLSPSCVRDYRKPALERVAIMAATRGAAVADGFQPAELLAVQTRQAWARVEV